MKNAVTVTSEPSGDTPLMLAHMKQMGLAEVLDQHLPDHGNRERLSWGTTAVMWLAHIISQSQHCMSHVQDLAALRLETLGAGIGQPVAPLDLADDRLAALLEKLADATTWEAITASVTPRLLRTYDLSAEIVRIDGTSVNGYWQVIEDNLFQYGHSKDHQSHLPQFKALLATLDPLGLPVASMITPGNEQDASCYVPLIEQTRRHLKTRGLLYVGDSKMASIGTRAVIVAGNDHYLMPLAKAQASDAWIANLLAPGFATRVPVRRLQLTDADGQPHTVACGLEVSVPLTETVNGQKVTWTERRFLVCSFRRRAAQMRGQATVLTKATAALVDITTAKRGKRNWASRDEVVARAAAIQKKYHVETVLSVEVVDGEPVGTRPTWRVVVTRNAAAIQTARRLMGWHVYATNASVHRLTMDLAFATYRHEDIIEFMFSRLKGRPLSLRPTYLHRPDHLRGLFHLLTLALATMTTFESQIRTGLVAPAEPLSGLYHGQPKRTTRRPRAELLLANFENITLHRAWVEGTCHVTIQGLTPKHDRILALLNLPEDPYAALCRRTEAASSATRRAPELSGATTQTRPPLPTTGPPAPRARTAPPTWPPPTCEGNVQLE